MKTFRSFAIAPLLAALLLSMQVPVASAASHRSMSGWLSFEFPDGWETVQTEQTRTRYVENVGVQPKGQDFAGRDGEFALRVFDPLYVYDEARLPSNAQQEQIFQAFIRSLPGEADAQFAAESSGGSTVYVARSLMDNVQKVYLAQRASNGYLMVVGGAASRNSTAQLERLIRDMLRSMRFAAPAGTNMEPANAVAQWYSALDKGDAGAVRALTCANAKGLQDLIGLFAGASDTRDMTEAMVRASRAFDRSGLRFFPLDGSESVGAVRIAGPVRRPDGSVIPFYKSAQTLGSNVLVVRKEAGGWKVCEPMRGRR